MATSQGRNEAQHKEGTKSRHAAGPVGQHPALEAQQADLEVLQRAIADPARARPGDILALQRVTGNRAVSGLLVQAKLVVGPVGDRYEQEADRVADQVLNMSVPDKAQRQEEEEEVQAKPETSTQIAASITPLVQKQEEEEELQTKPILQRQEEEEELQTKPLLQRQEEEEELQAKPLLQRQEEKEELQTKPLLQRQEEEEELQTKPLLQRQEEEELQMQPLQRQEEEEELQAKPAAGIQRQEEEEDVQMAPAIGIQRLPGGSAMAATPQVESAIKQARGGGQSLEDEVRGPMEQAFGADFSGVRVHTDSGADALNRSLQAKAFTTGNDIFFRSGAYEPENPSGQRLLAHELTHTMQQGASTRISRWGGVKSGVTLHKDVTADAFTKLSTEHFAFYELPGIKKLVLKFSEDMDAREACKFQLFTWKGVRELIESIAEWKPLRSWKPGKKLKRVRKPTDKGKFKPFWWLRPLGQTGYLKSSMLGKRSHISRKLLTEKKRQEAKRKWLAIESYASVKDPIEQENHAEGGMYEWPAGKAGATDRHVKRIWNWYRFATKHARRGDWGNAFMFLGLALHTLEDIGAHGHGMPGKGHDPRRQVYIPEKWGWPEAEMYRADHNKHWQFHWCDTRDQNPGGYTRAVRDAAQLLSKFARFVAGLPLTEEDLRAAMKGRLKPTLEWKRFYYPERVNGQLKMVYTKSKKGRKAAMNQWKRQRKREEKERKRRRKREEKEWKPTSRGWRQRRQEKKRWLQQRKQEDKEWELKRKQEKEQWESYMEDMYFADKGVSVRL